MNETKTEMITQTPVLEMGFTKSMVITICAVCCITLCLARIYNVAMLSTTAIAFYKLLK